MPITESIQINLVSKINPTVFSVVNADLLGNPPLRLGANHTAVKRMIVEKEHMLKMLMPSVLGISPLDMSWYKKVSEYWNSFSLNVPIGGTTLEVGFVYDLSDIDRVDYIKDIINKTKKDNQPTIKTDAELKLYINANIPEFEKYRYARPINALDYLNWVYCLGHHKVANKLTDLTKSENIEFTLIDNRDIVEIKRATHAISQEALKEYLGVLTDRDKVKNILYVLGKDPSALTDVDRDMELKHYCDTNPSKFVEIVNDKSLLTKAKIERLVVSGVLKRIPTTGIIIDSSDPSVIIGNTLEEAVVYFSSESAERVAKVKEFTAKYKSLKPNN